MEVSSERLLLDQFSPSTRQRTTALANQIPCHNCLQLCAGRLHLQSDFFKKEKEHLYERLSTRRPSTAAAVTTPESSVQGAPRNWWQKRTKVPKQTTQNHRASGNRCEVSESPVQKEEPEFKVDLRIEGIAQDVILKDEGRMDQIQKSGWQITNWISYQINRWWFGEDRIKRQTWKKKWKYVKAGHPQMVLVQPVLCSCTVGHITACNSRHDSDIHLIHRRLGPKSDRRENNSHLCAQRTLHPCCVDFHACMVAEPLFLELGYWFILGIAVLRYRVSMASAQEVEMLRRQLDELTTQMIEVRQQSTSTAMNAAVSGLAEAVRTIGQSVSKPTPEDMRVENQSRTHLAKTVTTGTSRSTDTRVRSILPILPCWTQRDNRQQWWWRLNSSLQHCCVSSRCSHRREHWKWWEKLETTVSKLTDNCAWCTERPIRKAARDYSCKSWLTSLVPRLKTWKTVWTNFWNWWDDMMRRTVPIPFPIKWKRRALFRTRLSLWRHIFSWMLGNWETSTHYAWRLTHLQDDFSRKHTRRRFNGSRCSLPKRERQREIRQGQEGR